MEKKPLLTICIPTWNREKCLRMSLERFDNQIHDVEDGELELIVSDNASDDHTPEVVEMFIQKGLPIIYNRNNENLGPDGNFLKCMHLAKGKYIFLLGDDDFLRPNALRTILDNLKKDDYGLIQLHRFRSIRADRREYENHRAFFVKLGIEITCMTGNIFLRDAVDAVDNPDQYRKTNLLQVPFYIQAALMKKKNLIINQWFFDYNMDSGNCGGYNFFKVFLNNFMTIWNSFGEKGAVDKSCLDAIKKKIYFSKLMEQVWYLLILQRNVVTSDASEVEKRKGYLVDDAWKYLNKYYGGKAYYYLSFIIMPFWATFRKMASHILSWVRKIKK